MNITIPDRLLINELVPPNTKILCVNDFDVMKAGELYTLQGWFNIYREVLVGRYEVRFYTITTLAKIAIPTTLITEKDIFHFKISGRLPDELYFPQ